ncbi:hypothetical protein [Metabacillus sp. Hm71]|uniref:hypothetical protein n=1 Tax=Metabacillus sp. Hm71 TaxID=3450743 RepID=UPI003F4425AD
MNSLKTGEYLTVDHDLDFGDLYLEEGTRVEKANYYLQHEGFVTVLVDNDVNWLSQESFKEFQ